MKKKQLFSILFLDLNDFHHLRFSDQRALTTKQNTNMTFFKQELK